MGHEVCYPLQHTLWLQHKCGQSDSCKIHAGTKLRNHTQENVLVCQQGNSQGDGGETLFSSSSCSTFSLSSSFLELPARISIVQMTASRRRRANRDGLVLCDP